MRLSRTKYDVIIIKAIMKAKFKSKFKRKRKIEIFIY